MRAPGRDAGRYRAAHLHQPDGWLSPGYLEIDDTGIIANVASERPDTWPDHEIRHLDGYVLPGMANLHSHAHQRGLAGRAEGIPGGAGRDDFWSWRTRMYAFIGILTPEDLEAIAAQAYVEMLKAGFTAVGEFHYLHHDRDDRPYANPAELSERILAAAGETGIALTLLPALYTHGGIGRLPTSAQRRFVHDDLDDFLSLVEQLLTLTAGDPLRRIGVAPHSLRAVSAENLTQLTEGIASVHPDAPIHMHVAEQTGEVNECLAALGARPLEWLLDHVDVDERWTLIHATHCTPAEWQAVIELGATGGLCPITEANLGDGLFPLRDYGRDGGRWGIGTDSNIAINLADELRVLDYGQRLFHQQRNILVTPGHETTEQPGRLLYDTALAGGARAVGQPIGTIRPGMRADLVELDPDAIPLIGHRPETALDGWIFGGGGPVVRNVMVAGNWVVRDGRHPRERDVLDRFRVTIGALAAKQ
ncbi:MAG TPA: formimidoylglutamate deiminase [Thermomicrobiales bacterium]|nr:formimidoylglutamate deiminase [Thermomicrobiales bacterium]